MGHSLVVQSSLRLVSSFGRSSASPVPQSMAILSKLW